MSSEPSKPPIAASLRPLIEDDLVRVVPIEGRVHVAPWTAEHFRAELGKPYSRSWVLTDDETDTEILAYGVFWMLFDEAQLMNVAVDLPYRGRGYAKLMIRHGVREAIRSNLKRLTLDVRKSNQPAIELYQKLGFTVRHVRKSFYSNGEDAYQMALDLEGEALTF